MPFAVLFIVTKAIGKTLKIESFQWPFVDVDSETVMARSCYGFCFLFDAYFMS